MNLSKSYLRARYREGLDCIPEHMRDGVENYIEHGREVGGFLTRLLEGDHERARIVADSANKYAWSDWMTFLLKYAPSRCFGSHEKVKAWTKMGGLQGLPE